MAAMKTRGGAVVAASIAALVLAIAPGSALADDAKNMAKEAGVGAASALASLIYGPTKLVYATGGLVVGGLAYGFSGGDGEVAKVVLTPSIYGDYIVSPENISGKRKVEFFGRAPEYRPDAQVSAPPQAPAPADTEEVAAAPAW